MLNYMKQPRTSYKRGIIYSTPLNPQLQKVFHLCIEEQRNMRTKYNFLKNTHNQTPTVKAIKTPNYPATLADRYYNQLEHTKGDSNFLSIVFPIARGKLTSPDGNKLYFTPGGIRKYATQHGITLTEDMMIDLTEVPFNSAEQPVNVRYTWNLETKEAFIYIHCADYNPSTSPTVVCGKNKQPWSVWRNQKPVTEPQLENPDNTTNKHSFTDYNQLLTNTSLAPETKQHLRDTISNLITHQKAAIMGAAGSGKTSLSQHVAQYTQILNYHSQHVLHQPYYPVTYISSVYAKNVEAKRNRCNTQYTFDTPQGDSKHRPLKDTDFYNNVLRPEAAALTYGPLADIHKTWGDSTTPRSRFYGTQWLENQLTHIDHTVTERAGLSTVKLLKAVVKTLNSYDTHIDDSVLDSDVPKQYRNTPSVVAHIKYCTELVMKQIETGWSGMQCSLNHHLKVAALAGTTIPGSLIICDETQNFTPLQAMMLENTHRNGAQLLLVGDETQKKHRTWSNTIPDPVLTHFQINPQHSTNLTQSHRLNPQHVELCNTLKAASSQLTHIPYTPLTTSKPTPETQTLLYQDVAESLTPNVLRNTELYLTDTKLDVLLTTHHITYDPACVQQAVRATIDNRIRASILEVWEIVQRYTHSEADRNKVMPDGIVYEPREHSIETWYYAESNRLPLLRLMKQDPHYRVVVKYLEKLGFDPVSRGAADHLWDFYHRTRGFGCDPMWPSKTVQYHPGRGPLVTTLWQCYGLEATRVYVKLTGHGVKLFGGRVTAANLDLLYTVFSRSSGVTCWNTETQNVLTHVLELIST